MPVMRLPFEITNKRADRSPQKINFVNRNRDHYNSTIYEEHRKKHKFIEWPSSYELWQNSSSFSTKWFHELHGREWISKFTKKYS